MSQKEMVLEAIQDLPEDVSIDQRAEQFGYKIVSNIGILQDHPHVGSSLNFGNQN